MSQLVVVTLIESARLDVIEILTSRIHVGPTTTLDKIIAGDVDRSQARVSVTVAELEAIRAKLDEALLHKTWRD